MNKLKNKTIYYYIIISFIIFSLFSSLVFIHYHNLFGASDLQFNLRRIFELKSSLLHGNILPSFAFNYFHGSALMSVYPYLSLYPIVLISLFTPSIISAYYIYFINIILLSFIISFFSSKKFSKSILISYIFSIIYSMSITFLMDMFIDVDIGIVTSLIFLPLVIFGFINLLYTHEYYMELVLGIVLMSFCQITAVTIITVFLVIWSLFNIKIFDKLLCINILKGIILSILLTSIIWIPFLSIFLFNNINTVKYVQLSGVNLKSYIKNIGVLPILAIFFPKISKNKIVKQMYILSLIVILISSKIMPWKLITSIAYLQSLNSLQFTARFLIIPHILLCYIISVTFVKLFKGHKLMVISLISVFMTILQITCQFYLINDIHKDHEYIYNYKQIEKVNSLRYDIPNDNNIKYIVNGYLGNTDYYPKKANPIIKYISNNDGYICKHPVLIKHSGYNSFVFKAYKDSQRMMIPLFCYKNENIKLYLNNKIIHYHVHNNVINIGNVKKGINKLTVQYIPNVCLIVIKFLLFIMSIFWIVTYFLKRHECI